MSFVIFAQINSFLSQKDFVAQLQKAYDDGVAGEFETRLSPGGYQVAFLRDEEDELPQTCEQLASEISEAGLPQIAADIRATGWLPFV